MCPDDSATTPTLFYCTTTTKVVKIAFWLVKTYDFTSQNMLYVLNRLKKSKMGEIGLKTSEIVKIGWNRKKITILTERMHWSKMSPPCSSCPAPIGVQLNAQSHGLHSLQNMWILSAQCIVQTIKKWMLEIKRAAEIECNKIRQSNNIKL